MAQKGMAEHRTLCLRDDARKDSTFVVVILPWRNTSVVKLLTRAFLWSAGLPSLAILFRCLMANTLLPFCGNATMLLCEQPTQNTACFCTTCWGPHGIQAVAAGDSKGKS